MAEEEAPSEEELDAMIAEAESGGRAQAEPNPPPADGEGEGGEGESPEAGSETVAEKSEGEGTGADGGAPEAPAVGAPPTGDPGLPWEQVKTGFPWDEEIAHLDTFAEPRLGTVPTPGANVGEATAAQEPPDRLALVGSALGKGAMTGLVEGAKGIVIDTAINMASSKIPMVAGFVELGKAIYDPAQYLADTMSGLTGGGKFGEAWTRFTSGDPIEIIAGLVDVVDGISSIIGTLSSICWLLAGLGFVLSWIPGMQWLIPFVALAAQWGTVLGGVGTVLSVWASLARLVLVPLRALDILFLANDEDLDAKAGALQEQTAALTQSFTERAGDNLRGQIQERQTNRNNTGADRSGGGQADSGISMKAVMLDGLIARRSDGTSGASMGAAWKDVRNTAGATRDMSKASGTHGRIDALESRGIDSTSAFNSKLHGKQEDARTQRLQQDLDAATRRYDDAQRAANAHAERAAERRREIDNEYASAKQDGEFHARMYVEHRARVQDLSTLETSQRRALTEAESALGRAKSVDAHAAQAGVSGTREQVRLAQAEVDSQKRALEQTRTALTESRDNMARHDDALNQALRRKFASAGERDRHTRDTEPVTTRLNEGVDSTTGAKNSAEKALGTHTGRRDVMDGYTSRTDYKGDGPAESHLYGQNRGVGRTGSLTGVLTGSELSTDLTAAMYEVIGFSEESAAGMTGQAEEDSSYGLDSPSHYAENMVPRYSADDDWSFTETVGDEAKEIGSQFDPGMENLQEEGNTLGDWWGGVRGRYSDAHAAVTPPPLHVPDEVDGAHLAYLALQSEEVEARDNAARLEGARVTAEAQLPELDAADGLVQTQLEDITGYQTGLDELQGRNDELASKATEAQAQAGNSSSKAGEGAGMIGGFVGPFISLMGRVPGRFVGNAGEGAAGAKQMQAFATDGPGELSSTTSMASEASAEAAVRTQQNSNAKAAGDVAVGNVNSLQSEVANQRTQATTGISELVSAQSENDAYLASIESEKSRLSAEHAAASSEGASWALERQSMRLGDMGALESMLGDAEARLAE